MSLHTGQPPAFTLHKTVLCIIDGLGYSKNTAGNAVAAANMSNLSRIMEGYPSFYITASGREVGLDSDKDAGNSEVGHNAIGAGKTIKQGLSLLNDMFAPSAAPAIFATSVWERLSAAARKQKLNIIILLSDGRVHSDIAHLFAVLEQCGRENITVSIFAITDGRDVSPRSAVKYIRQTQEFIDRTGVSAKIAVIGGRGQIFMDRYESQPELLTKAFEVCVEGKGEAARAPDMIEQFYTADPTATDEQIPPFITDKSVLIKNGDAVLLLNYRGDRAIETCKMFETGAYITKAQFEQIKDCCFVGILQYDAENNVPKNFLCPPPKIDNTLTEHLCKYGIRQYTVTETVKFGHMTYFFNGNRTTPLDPKLEEWAEIESDKLNSRFDKAPKMKAAEIADKLIFNIRHGDYTFLKCNFPNPDMVGHTGNFDAAVEACRSVDAEIERIFTVCKNDGVNLIITADHGNAEEMLDSAGKVKTSHTNNLVPLVICPFALNRTVKLKDGFFGLTNIAATVCDLLGVPKSNAFNSSVINIF